MIKRLQGLPYRSLFRIETLKRTMPIWLLVALMLAAEACGGKKY
jgi:hypothetical protein